jgi:hypothetical protein
MALACINKKYPLNKSPHLREITNSFKKSIQKKLQS